MYIILMSGLIYPVGSSWILGKGWLYQMGFHDAAGAGYIHMVGGISGLIGTIILGPRYGTFDTYTDFIKERSLSKRKLRLNQGRGGRSLMSYLSENDLSSEEANSFLSSNQARIREFEGRNKNLNYFYNHDQETPMKQRVFLLRKLFTEFSALKDDQLVKLIKIYDTNLN